MCTLLCVSAKGMGLTHEHIPTKCIICKFMFSFYFHRWKKKISTWLCCTYFVLPGFFFPYSKWVSQSVSERFHPIFIMCYIFTVWIVIYLKLTLWICVSLNDLFVCSMIFFLMLNSLNLLENFSWYVLQFTNACRDGDDILAF